jgi:hypothetical protein
VEGRRLGVLVVGLEMKPSVSIRGAEILVLRGGVIR